MLSRSDYQAITEAKGTSANRGEGAQRALKYVQWLLDEKKATVDDFSYLSLAASLGCIDPYDTQGSLRRALAAEVNTEKHSPESYLTESNPGVNTSLFKIITGELIGRKMIEGYETSPTIGEQLVMTEPARFRNQRIAGFKALGGQKAVDEGHPYEETGFEEKYVTTRETKYGRILSINEELIGFDQTGEINRRAMGLGDQIKQERERTIVRGVIDADAGSSIYVYRPSGTGEALYNADGSNQNYVGVGNTTTGVAAFQAAVALQDWTDLELARRYRATEVKDDRIDGTPRPIGGLNGPGLVMLVPEALNGTGKSIVNSTEVRRDVTNERTTMANPVRDMATVLSSPYIDEVGGDALTDWYLGQFRKQFVWTEIWPLQTFTQGGDSGSAFDRDVAMRVKVRYFGGISAIDSVWVTKVDGA